MKDQDRTDGARPRPLGTRLPRRTFLKMMGASAAGLVVARSAAGQSGPAAVDAVDEVQALALELDFDVDRIFRYVADEIWYEPYSGVLRGAQGTLASGAGNAADQSLLLAALLQASAVPTRFVIGRLDEAAMSQVLLATEADVTHARERAVAALTGGLPGTALSPPPAGVLPPDLESIAARAEEITAAANDWLVSRLDAHVAMIVDALGHAGIDLPASADLRSLARDQHVWVRYQRGAEWLDLEPTFPGIAPGSRIAVTQGQPLASLPDTLRHRVELTVSVESVRGGMLVEEAILEHSLFADEAAGTPMALLHEKPEGLRGIGITLANALGGQMPQYNAVLVVADDVIIGDTGITLGGGEGGPFDTEATADHEGEAMAEWLDVRVIPPAGAPTTARRTLFDRIGEAARASGVIDVKAVPPAPLVSISPEGPGEFPPMLTLRFLSLATGATSVESLRRLGDDTDEVMAIGSAAHTFHLSRDAASATHALERGVRSYLDGSNLAMFSATPVPSADGGWSLATGFDLIHRSQGDLPVARRSPVWPPGIVNGVLAHLVERLHGGDGPLEAVDASAAPPETVSVGRIVEEAVEQGIDMVVLRDDVPASAPYPPDAVVRLKSALVSGWVAVVPARPVSVGGAERVGWWLIDPSTGRTLDQLEDGTGASFGGYGRLLLNVYRTAKPWICLGWTLYDMYHFVHSMMEINPTGALAFALASGTVHRKVCH